MKITVIGAKTISETTPDSDTKTSQSMSLLRWLQLDGTIPVIRESNHVARSFTRSKYYNAPASMRVVMDSDVYLHMTIPTIKRRDSGGYEKFVTCKSCSYGDSRDSHLRL